MATDLDGLESRLRDVALAYPDAHEDFPWGERALKVKGKMFLLMSRAEERLSVTVKLPASHVFATMAGLAEPTGYGLGKSGWVTCRLGSDQLSDVALLESWIDESYRAVAPKRLVAQLPPLAEVAPAT